MFLAPSQRVQVCLHPKIQGGVLAEEVRNLERDQIVREELKVAGIRRLVIWECTVNAMMKAPAFCEDVIAMASTFLKSDAQELEL